MAYATEAVESLAAEIGENIYMDIAKWHLYLGDAKLHTSLAERFYPMMEDGKLTEDAVMQTLQSMTVKVGGQRELPLSDLIPAQNQQELVRLLEDYQRNL